LSKKIDPSVVDEDKKYMAKEYSNIAAKLYLRPDHMFQGQLMSILQCQECRSVSCTYETFLDISLPVVSARHPPNLSRKKSIDPDAPSKHQLKKAKQQSKKKKKATRFAAVGPINKNDADVEADAEDDENKEQEGEKPASERNGDCGPDKENVPEEKGLLETEGCENKEKLAICEENGETAVQGVTEKMSTLLSSVSKFHLIFYDC
jgi:ubiquitin carboxyl-terminal hydrolase 16/45